METNVYFDANNLSWLSDMISTNWLYVTHRLMLTIYIVGSFLTQYHILCCLPSIYVQVSSRLGESSSLTRMNIEYSIFANIFRLRKEHLHHKTPSTQAWSLVLWYTWKGNVLNENWPHKVSTYTHLAWGVENNVSLIEVIYLREFIWSLESVNARVHLIPSDHRTILIYRYKLSANLYWIEQVKEYV